MRWLRSTLNSVKSVSFNEKLILSRMVENFLDVTTDQVPSCSRRFATVSVNIVPVTGQLSLYSDEATGWMPC